MEQNNQFVKKVDFAGPRFSLIIPFSPEMNSPKLLFNLLTSAVDKAEKEISIKYSKEKAFLLIKGLRDAIKGIKRIPKQKTLAIFVSGLKKNIYYFTATKTLHMPDVLVLKTDNENKKFRFG